MTKSMMWINIKRRQWENVFLVKKPLWNKKIEDHLQKSTDNQVEILKIWGTILEPYQRDGRKIVYVICHD